jgi:hypothetical protein
MTLATTIRLAEGADADAIGQLLHDFKRRVQRVIPGPRALAERVHNLLA